MHMLSFKSMRGVIVTHLEEGLKTDIVNQLDIALLTNFAPFKDNI